MNLKQLAMSSALVSSMVMSGSVFAEITGNIGVTSNYIWHGLTQTNDEAAVSGGLDYSHESGFYLGTWTSNLAGGQYEVDYYGGFASEASGVGYDVGVILYSYPVDSSVEADFTEVYIGGSYSYFSAKISEVVNAESDASGADDGTYIEAAFDYPLTEDLGLGVHLGSATGDLYKSFGGDEYTDWSLSLSKGDFSFAFWGTDLDNNLGDMRAVVSWGQEF